MGTNGAVSSDRHDEPGMKFAFTIHPISEQTKNLMDLDCAEWALVSDSAQAILSKSAGEMGPT